MAFPFNRRIAHLCLSLRVVLLVPLWVLPSYFLASKAKGQTDGKWITKESTKVWHGDEVISVLPKGTMVRIKGQGRSSTHGKMLLIERREGESPVEGWVEAKSVSILNEKVFTGRRKQAAKNLRVLAIFLTIAAGGAGLLWMRLSGTLLRAGKRFSFPEEADLYSITHGANAFQVLGFQSSAEPRQLRHRHQKLLSLVETEIDPRHALGKDYFSLPWPNERPVNKELLNQALANLRLANKALLAEEFFWFSDLPENVSERLMDGNFRAGRRALARERRREGDPLRRAKIVHDMAVLEHRYAVGVEKGVTDSTGRMTFWQFRRWRRALSLWAEVCLSEHWWKHFHKRSEDLEVPVEWFNALQEQMPGLLLKVHLLLAKLALAHHRPSYARQHIELIKTSRMNQRRVWHRLRQFFIPWRTKVNDLLLTAHNLPSHSYIEKAIKIEKEIRNLGGDTVMKNELASLAEMCLIKLGQGVDEMVTMAETMISRASETLEARSYDPNASQLYVRSRQDAIISCNHLIGLCSKKVKEASRARPLCKRTNRLKEYSMLIQSLRLNLENAKQLLDSLGDKIGGSKSTRER